MARACPLTSQQSPRANSSHGDSSRHREGGTGRGHVGRSSHEVSFIVADPLCRGPPLQTGTGARKVAGPPLVPQLNGRATAPQAKLQKRVPCQEASPRPGPVPLLPPWPRPPAHLPSSNHLLGGVDRLAAAGAALGAADLLGELGRVGVGGGPVAGGPAWGRMRESPGNRRGAELRVRGQGRGGSGVVSHFTEGQTQAPHGDLFLETPSCLCHLLWLLESRHTSSLGPGPAAPVPAAAGLSSDSFLGKSAEKSLPLGHDPGWTVAMHPSVSSVHPRDEGPARVTADSAL